MCRSSSRAKRVRLGRPGPQITSTGLAGLFTVRWAMGAPELAGLPRPGKRTGVLPDLVYAPTEAIRWPSAWRMGPAIWAGLLHIWWRRGRQRPRGSWPSGTTGSPVGRASTRSSAAMWRTHGTPRALSITRHPGRKGGRSSPSFPGTPRLNTRTLPGRRCADDEEALGRLRRRPHRRAIEMEGPAPSLPSSWSRCRTPVAASRRPGYLARVRRSATSTTSVRGRRGHHRVPGASATCSP